MLKKGKRYMRYLEKENYFPDFFYYRTASPVYRKYLGKCGIQTYNLQGTPQFGRKKDIFVGYIITHERIDKEPDIEYLKTNENVSHALVVRIPNSQINIPKGWKKLRPTGHFKETGITLLEDGNYYQKWTERARRARKKFLNSPYKIHPVSVTTFVNAFKEKKIKTAFKKDWIEYYTSMTNIAPESIRQRLCYNTEGKAVAGLAVHDYLENSSVHLVAFTGEEAYPIQGGTGLIDRWFADSLEKNIKYLSLDQLRQKFGPRDQKGYTEFKKNFIEFHMVFPNAYFKIF